MLLALTVWYSGQTHHDVTHWFLQSRSEAWDFSSWAQPLAAPDSASSPPKCQLTKNGVIDRMYTVSLSFLKIFLGFLCLYFMIGQLKGGQETGEREGEWHAAKGHTVESNPLLLQREHSLCIWGACSTHWATRCTYIYSLYVFPYLALWPV